MVDKLRENEIEEFDRKDPETAEVIGDLLRALRRKKGFGLFFVQCSPAQGQQMIEAVQKRFPQKKIVEIALTRKSETLYGDLLERYQAEKVETAFVTGVEQALYDYEDTKRLGGWSSAEIYNYSWKGVPPLLSHLNRQREAFEANLPIALVFLVPSFVIDYFVQRAPDFFDWRSGFFKFVESSEELKRTSQELTNGDYQEYLALTPDQRIEKILEIKDKISHLDPSDYKEKSNLFREHGRLFESDGELDQALDCYERSLAADHRNYRALYSKGSLLNDLGRHEGALESYDRALALKPDYHYAWDRRGDALGALERYQEAIESYNSALALKPDYHTAWGTRGDALGYLNRYEEAIESYDRVLSLKPDYHYAWGGRGDALKYLKRYEEAIESYDHALALKPDYLYALKSKGFLLYQLHKPQEASICSAKALEIQPTDEYLWNNQAYLNLAEYSYGSEAVSEKPLLIRQFQDFRKTQNATNIDLARCQNSLRLLETALNLNPGFIFAWANKSFPDYYLQQYQSALQSCAKALELNADNGEEINEVVYTNRGCILLQLNNYSAALQDFNTALKIAPQLDEAWNGQGTALYLLGRYSEARQSFTEALNLHHPLAGTGSVRWERESHFKIGLDGIAHS